MKRATLVLVALALLLGGVGQAKAGIIQNHAETDILGYLRGNQVFNTFDVQPLTSQLSGMASESGASIVANAQVQNVGNTWRLVSSVHSVNRSSGQARAVWKDILFLSNTDPRRVGRTLRLNFQATGSETYSNGGNAFTYKDVTGSNGGSLVLTEASLTHDTGFTHAQGWDSLTGSGQTNTGGSYSGTFHLDIPITQTGGYVSGIPGSIYYQVETRITAGTNIDSGDFSFVSDPAEFLSITLPDMGNVTPESLGVGITFDSGIVSPNLQPSAVPEPATLTLLGIGIAGVAGYGWRRRKQAVTA